MTDAISSSSEDISLWPMRYDLHSHSNSSDGFYTPSELVAYAQKRGVEVLALTDHDTSRGVQEALDAGIKLKMHVVVGIELSCLWHGNQIHIVGLCFDPKAEAMRTMEANQAEKRDARAREIGAKLEKWGFKDAYARTLAMAAPGASITRGNYSAFLVSVGAAVTEDKCFKQYLSKGAPAYVAPKWGPLEDVVKAILESGGIPVLAHPRRYDLNNKWIRKLVKDFKNAGGEAMEVAGAMQAPSEREFLCSLASEYGLYASCGSDFHHEKPYVDFGIDLHIPEGVEPVWKSPKFHLGC